MTHIDFDFMIKVCKGCEYLSGDINFPCKYDEYVEKYGIIPMGNCVGVRL